MRRVRGVVVAGVLAVAVSAVAAGPAVAAKGGNSDNAHACQQGGHQNRFEAETGNPFKNAGDCASHGAKGGATSTLQFLTVPLYNCSGDESGTCWGIVSGSGLTPGADWFVFDRDLDTLRRGTTSGDGSVPPTALNFQCGGGAGVGPFIFQTFTSSGAPIVADVVSPC